jgi:hypothetical protein
MPFATADGKFFQPGMRRDMMNSDLKKTILLL